MSNLEVAYDQYLDNCVEDDVLGEKDDEWTKYNTPTGFCGCFK